MTKDMRSGFKVGDKVRIEAGYMGRCWNEGLIGTITGFDDCEGHQSQAIINVELEERVGTGRLSRVTEKDNQKGK